MYEERLDNTLLKIEARLISLPQTKQRKYTQTNLRYKWALMSNWILVYASVHKSQQFETQLTTYTDFQRFYNDGEFVYAVHCAFFCYCYIDIFQADPRV